MKKVLLALLAVCMFVPAVRAEEVEAFFKIGNFKFNVPIRENLEFVALYDIWQGDGLLGGETQIAEYKDLNLNFGAVSSFLGKGTPYLSLDFDFSEAKPKLANIGVWLGYDFNLDVYRAGVKASTKIW